MQALQRLEAPQKITTTDIEERDVFAAHVEGERAAVQVFFVRDGKVVAREGFLLDRLTEPERVLSDTLQQFYAQGRYVPREIVVPAEIPDRELLEAWLTERRGTNVRIHLPQRGEKVRLVELVARNARLAFELEWKHPRKQSQEILRSLRDLLDLELEPNRIECFDISNIQGSDVVASMVVFEEGLPEEVGLPQVPDPQRLRRPGRLRLDARGRGPPLQAPARGVEGAARPRADRRRQGPAVRGGRGARGAGPRRAAGRLPRQARGAHLPPRPRSPDRLPRTSPVLQLVQRVRDEAHRFAIGYHRQVRSKRTIASELDDIPGIGPAKRRKLLSAFGSVRGVRGASEAELAGVVGKSSAARLRAHFDGAST